MFRCLIYSLLSILVFVPMTSFGTPHTDCNNCCTDCHNDKRKSCVSGDMQVVEQTKGIVRVSQLSEGDVIMGIVGAEQTSAWCKVVVIFPGAHGQNRTTHDGFTPGHMVLDGSVQAYGHKGEVRNGPVFTLVTDCDATLNVDGQVFTPISTDFCPHELSWSEYLTLIGAIRRVTSKTGNFWFDLDAYHDNNTAMVPSWVEHSTAICREILRCAREGSCQEFENVMQEFVHEHLNPPYMEMITRVFPNLGGDVKAAAAGTITEVVRSHGRGDEELIVILSAVGGAIVLVMLIISAAVLLYRRRVVKKKPTKELGIPNQVSVNADDLNA